MHHDVVVIGAGAAGLMCAIEAGKRGRRVLLLERNDRVGRKILISGGGRCNFTNLYASPEQFISDNPNFCRSALASYTPDDFIALVEQHGIAYHEKKLGQLFCNGNARQIVDMLLAECDAAGVEIRGDCEVWGVERPRDDASRFALETSDGDFDCESLVVACGGLSIPKIGATDMALHLATQFGIAVRPPRPGLVPLILDGDDRAFAAALSGVSLDVVASCRGQSFRENLLFTHRGLSGPAVLQASSYWREGEPIELDLLPQESAAELLELHAEDPRSLITLLGEHWPRRFAQSWCIRYAPDGPVGPLTVRQRNDLAQRLNCWQLWPSGTEGYEKAEVTVGGIDTRELSSRTMASRRVPGLYFIGECVDVTGWLGGYNFQWAWAS
ncbi:MAG TPA: NAD(P)/FAD-dependent oxidoreductase, partial [Dehalococcoidia bacterium]|nr:NAD(P)/FAD-dependent oxidoreductase [Dehalococcoidia bacterium]